jgi:GNAT superfamily N-acetyltransferase
MNAGESLLIEHHEADAVPELRNELISVYEAVYAEHLGDPFFAVDRYWERVEAYARREGFALVTGRVDDKLIGYALGYPLPADTRWWSGLHIPVDADLTRETGSRTFALNEIMVLAEHRRKGVARLMHDTLLSRRREERATLLVHPLNTVAAGAYTSWGWKTIGVLRPFPDAPLYYSMTFDLWRQ